jgi:hypothetical protein
MADVVAVAAADSSLCGKAVSIPYRGFTMRWSGWMVGALVVAIPSVARAQNMNMSPMVVSGRVFDDTTGCPLRGAKVTLELTSTSTTTDANGRYRLATSSMGKIDMVAMLNGYLPRHHDGISVTDSSSRVDFSLVRATGDSAMHVKYPPAKCHLEPTGAKADSGGRG